MSPQRCLEDDVTTHSGVHVEGVLEAAILINGVLDKVGGPGTLVQGYRCVAQCVARLVCRGSYIKTHLFLKVHIKTDYVINNVTVPGAILCMLLKRLSHDIFLAFFGLI